MLLISKSEEVEAISKREERGKKAAQVGGTIIRDLTLVPRVPMEANVASEPNGREGDSDVPTVYLVVPNSNPGGNQGPHIRAAAAFGANELVLVGFESFATHGAHGAQRLGSQSTARMNPCSERGLR